METNSSPFSASLRGKEVLNHSHVHWVTEKEATAHGELPDTGEEDIVWSDTSLPDQSEEEQEDNDYVWPTSEETRRRVQAGRIRAHRAVPRVSPIR